MTKKDYLYEKSALEADAVITAMEPGESPRVRLDRTAFHAKGGGQLADKGWLDQVTVLDVRHAEDGNIDHFLASVDGLSIGNIVHTRIDAQTRLINSRLHTAGHLIANVLDQPFPGARAVQAHHYPGEARVEFEAGADLVEPIRHALPRLIADAISADLPVHVEGDPERSRRIRIGHFSPIPCGGTHVSTLQELIRVDITSVKMKNGRLRVSYSISC